MWRPMWCMAPITSSQGTLVSMPARASSAASSALEAPAALRLMQGTSTRPANGSQARPSMFFSARAMAWAACSGLPPAISVTAEAAMALAEPISAWQPPAAPEMPARLAITKPTAPAVNRWRTTTSSGSPIFSWMASITPGRTPEEPAVGVAQMRPMAAFTSLVAMA